MTGVRGAVAASAAESSLRYDRPMPIQLDEPWSSHALLLPRVPAGSRVLEIGCSTGYLTRYLSGRLGCHVVAVELDRDAAAQARPHAARLVEGSAEDEAVLADVTRERYDVLFLAAVLEHLLAPDRVLARLLPALAPGGRVLVSLPNVAHWRVRFDLLCGHFDYTPTGILDHTHLHLYTRRSGRALLESAGLSVVWSAVSGVPPVMRVWRHLPSAVRAMARLAPGLVGFELLYEARCVTQPTSR